MAIAGCGSSDDAASPIPSNPAGETREANSNLAQIVRSVPVRFTVQNRNRSLALCAVDRRTYEIRGRLVGPESAFAGGSDAVTVYMHGVGWGQFYWHFREFPELDYASQMARLGHVSLVYDQLGYGASGRPPGLLNCYGGEADIVNQMIDDLRAGTYVFEGGTAPRFPRVALASHQAAALMAQPSAYSFRNIDALIVTAFSDFALAFKPAVILSTGRFLSSCALGGERSDGSSGPFFYEFFPKTGQRFADVGFADADPAVISRATQLRGRASCGELASAFATVGADNLQILLRQIRVPVLLVNGLEDAFFVQPLGANAQRPLYGASPDVSSELIAGAGQALALERSAPEFRRVMHDWLAARGF